MKTKEFKKHPSKYTRLIGRGSDMIQAIHKAFFTCVVIFLKVLLSFSSLHDIQCKITEFSNVGNTKEKTYL